MIEAATRQDVHSALERAKSSIIGTMFSRNDAQTSITQLRNGILQDLRVVHTENQTSARIAQNQHDQILQRMASLQQQLNRLAEQQAQMLSVIHHILEPNGTVRRF